MDILNYDESAGAANSKVIATFDLELANGLILRRWKVLRSPKAASGWFAVSPSYKLDGSEPPRFAPYCDISASRREEFNKAVRVALEPFVRV